MGLEVLPGWLGSIPKTQDPLQGSAVLICARHRDGKEPSNDGGSGRMKWQPIKHSRCLFLLIGESDHRGGRKVGNELEIGRYIKGTEKKQKKNR